MPDVEMIWETDKRGIGCPYMSLWSAVILLAIEDAVKSDNFSYFGTTDFKWICAMLDVPVKNVLNFIKDRKDGFNIS